MREMKDSGVTWIGDIPKEWSIAPLKGLGRFYGGLSGKAGDDFVVEEGDYYELFVPFTNIFNNNVIQLDKLFKVKIFNGEKQTLVHKGDILFLMSSEDFDGLGKASLMNDEVENLHLNSFCKGFCPFDRVFPSYLNYYLQGQPVREYIRSNGNGFIRINLKVSKLGTTPVLLPSLEEQRRIADFLDAKCAEIDSILEQTRASIEEYKALKQSVITEAVTKGIRGDRSMKDSGVEWIGEIPSDWDVLSFYKNNYIRGRLGWKGLKADEYVLEGFPFLSAFNIIENHLDWNELNYITQERYDESPEIKLSVGDLLVVKDGAGIGKCARVDALPLGPATVNSSLAVITSLGRLDYRFEYYYLLSAPFQQVIWFLKIGMGVPHLTQEKMREISIPCPSLVEQREIAAYLDEKCSTIDSLIASKEALIGELEAYKKSLIYEYVTGKKEVL